jgi:hypothetical protein
MHADADVPFWGGKILRITEGLRFCNMVKKYKRKNACDHGEKRFCFEMRYHDPLVLEL